MEERSRCACQGVKVKVVASKKWAGARSRGGFAAMNGVVEASAALPFGRLSGGWESSGFF